MNFDLSTIPLFSSLSPANLDAISRHVQHHKYPKNHVIFNEGDRSDSLYIILNGEIRIYISDDSQEMWLNTLGPGDYFGELGLIDQGPRTASARTESEADLYVISSEKMLLCLHEAPEIAITLLQMTVKMLRESTDMQKQLAMMDVYGRLRATLLKLANSSNGQIRISPRPTQKELASRIGASREMVSRQMSDLKAGGYIQCDKSSITICKNLPARW
jgi:CRP/FNR family cyclic AMP-dependent transcriptional regulator